MPAVLLTRLAWKTTVNERMLFLYFSAFLSLFTSISADELFDYSRTIEEDDIYSPIVTKELDKNSDLLFDEHIQETTARFFTTDAWALVRHIIAKCSGIYVTVQIGIQ